MKSFIKFIVFVIVTSLATTLAFKTWGSAMGFGVMVLSFMALFIIYKAKIYTILGRQKYMKDHDAGFRLMQKAYDTGKMNPQDALIYAYMLLRDGHLDKAERLITGIVHQNKHKLTPKNILASELNQAIIKWKKNDLAGAIEMMEGIYNKGYRSTVHYQTLGIFYLLNNNLDKAGSFIMEAMDFNSDDLSIRDNLGLLYIKKGDWEKAEAVYESIFDEASPTFIEAHYNYATVLEHYGDWDNACKYYQKALGCPERYLSTVKLSLVETALTRAEEHLK